MYSTIFIQAIFRLHENVQQVTDWFYNKNRKVVPKPTKVYGRAWNVRSVVQTLYTDRVDEVAKQLSDQDRAGGPNYLACYQTATNNVLDALTEDERAEVDKSLDEWNNTSVPEAVQIK